ncbi:1-deoxy-D-xylulose-5-phosphate synthase [Candidatus Ornithobacterium hominis]|uniref:1-deoxy-D-xylulose-5-phosphate synthase n=1 Tax=Candidatus Ornithobacterium hominis TaxID=2497989 RepID=UPI0024BC12F3|nr:1-deoxy-D-xylulose-5-phosphate synthase [Candidatus Ornithobacterium hominis]CAI9429224.1 1-deoxy-D-xylulose-5-phosphate synthase [Candidatus Ornithobacterium hominis]
MLDQYRLLSTIDNPQDLKKLNAQVLPKLAAEIRDYILNVVALKKGHLGASLGVTELSIALHYYLNTPQDILLWDVGHQSYVHKILTGRKEKFLNLRQKNEISGFPVREESEYDCFGVGHSSTTISALTGIALADKLKDIERKRFAVIGDASIASGMALEGLNHLGDTDLDVTVILNDNNIGIDHATGALKNYFNRLGVQGDTFFSDLGFHYQGVVNGHDFSEIFKAFKKIEKISRPKILHIRTIKGKGYAQAEQDQVAWHAPGKFNKISGEREIQTQKETYPDLAGKTLHRVFEKNKKAVAISPAMLSGSSLMELKEKFPDRVWDVGIAEQHAVTLSAGLASQGMVPYCVIYSTFLQRAYDQLIHDVALQELPVIFLIDRAGLVGSDGATHHGYFDISFLNAIPQMILAAPLDATELKSMIQKAPLFNQPVAIRYAKTSAETFFKEEQLKFFKAREILNGEKMVILSTGSIGLQIFKALKKLNKNIGWVHFPFIKPLDEVKLAAVFKKYNRILTYEEGVKPGGFGMSCLAKANEMSWKGKMEICAFPSDFISHASISEQMEDLGFSVEGIMKKVEKFFLEN